MSIAQKDWRDYYQTRWEDSTTMTKRRQQFQDEVMHERIPPKLIFHFRLKGLEYGGFLDEWVVYPHREGVLRFMPSEKASHRQPIIVDRTFISAKKFDGVTTEVIRSHYPDDYVATTDTYYYYLGERKMTHNNIEMVEDRSRLDGAHIYRLFDYGDGREQVATFAMQWHITHLDYSMSPDVMYNIREQLFRKYKAELRRGV